jgi:single-stranded DNA-binding protein
MKNPESGIENTLKKGTIIYLDRAELRSDKYQDKSGIERTKMKIMIYSFDIIDRVNKIEPEVPAVKKEDIKTDNTEEFIQDPDDEIPF